MTNNPEETPEQQQIRQLSEQVAQLQRERDSAKRDAELNRRACNSNAKICEERFTQIEQLTRERDEARAATDFANLAHDRALERINRLENALRNIVGELNPNEVQEAIDERGGGNMAYGEYSANDARDALEILSPSPQPEPQPASEEKCTVCGNPRHHREHDLWSQDCNHAFTTELREPPEQPASENEGEAAR